MMVPVKPINGNKGTDHVWVVISYYYIYTRTKLFVVDEKLFIVTPKPKFRVSEIFQNWYDQTFDR